MDNSAYFIAALLLLGWWSWVCYKFGERRARRIDADRIIQHLRDEEPPKPATRQQLFALQMLSHQLGVSPPRKNISEQGAWIRIEELLAAQSKLRDQGVLPPADPDGPERSITDKQLKFIARLSHEVGDEFDEREIARMTVAEASVYIDLLLEDHPPLRQRTAREQRPQWDAEGKLPSQ